jgi:hypothetical protein
MKRVQKGHVTLKWYMFVDIPYRVANTDLAGILGANQGFDQCGRDIVEVSAPSCA